MADDIKAQFEKLEHEREKLENRVRVQAEKKAWDEDPTTKSVLAKLTRIQNSCIHSDKRYLGKNITTEWCVCNDCGKLVDETDYSGF